MADEESVSISSDLGNANDALDADVVTTPAETTMPSTEAETALITTTRSSNFLHIVEPMQNVTINSGKEVRLKCHVKGHPKPKFRWFKNEAPLEAERRGRITIRKEHDGSKIRIKNVDVPDTGYYRCEASNGFEKVETTGILKVLMVPGRSATPLEIDELEDTADYTVGDITHVDEDVEDPMSLVPGAASIRAPNLKGPGMCQPYKGTACTKFLQNTTVFTSGTQSIAQIEEGLMAAFSLVPKQTDLSTQCAEYAVPSLCYNMFPVCDEPGNRQDAREGKIRRQLCRDECELLETEICRKEYAVANQHPVLKEFTPDCHDLPPPSSAEHRKCIRLGLRAPARAEKLTREECYEGNGQEYSGVQKMTESGEECRKWDGIHHPDMAHHNYCRNPSGNMAKPWCHNAKTDVPEKCHISQCVLPPDNMMNNLVLIAGCGAALLLLVTFISLCICIRRRMAKKQSKLAFKANIKANPLELNALIPKYQIHGHVPEVQMNNLRFLDVLGDGVFGKVYAGDVMADGGIRPVIIRMVREGGGVKLKQDFLRELSQWSDYRHPNVAALVGSHQVGEPFALIFEHSTYGDLHEYLEAMAVRSPNWRSDRSNADCHPSVTYLQMATQVAAGLEYLAANLFVHRDVASKNCWVFDNGQIKVADHGVGPSRYPMDYSRVGNTTIPIRWMAPEAINYGQSTLHSSVWSFGVVMWEIWTEGMQPYFGFSHHEILEMIRTRQLLAQPEDCSANIYALMVECWHENPVRRPSFKELHQRLKGWEAARPGLSVSSNQDHSSGRSRSTTSQHSSSGPGSQSNNTGTTHISNGFVPILPLPQFSFGGVPNSPAFSAKFGSSFPRRQPAQTQTMTSGSMAVPPSPLLRGSAMNTPVFRGPKFSVNQSVPSIMNNLEFESFRTTNL